MQLRKKRIEYEQNSASTDAILPYTLGIFLKSRFNQPRALSFPYLSLVLFHNVACLRYCLT